jgi:hypothetical protein
MKTLALGIAASLMVGVACAQTTATPPASSGNQAVATTQVNANTPSKGANSFTMGEAKSRIEKNGFSNVTGLAKDNDGIWRGQASKAGTAVAVWLDYKGNVGTN